MTALGDHQMIREKKDPNMRKLDHRHTQDCPTDHMVWVLSLGQHASVQLDAYIKLENRIPSISILRCVVMKVL